MYFYRYSTGKPNVSLGRNNFQLHMSRFPFLPQSIRPFIDKEDDI